MTVSPRFRWAWFTLLVAYSIACRPATAQSRPSENPASVLRDAMMAACAHKADDFRQVLTTRNATAYSRITPAARATFMKRFVLLDSAGEPHSQNTSNDSFVVTCVNPEATAQITIGKPEPHDNLAFVPFDIKEASDTTGEGTRHAQIGMVRENGHWKLLSLGLLFLDLPSLEVEWDRAEIAVNEKSAVSNLKEIAEAVENYRKTYTRLPDTLLVLGPPAEGPAKMEKAGMLNDELARGRKEGYVFRYVIVGASSSGAPAKYELAGIPAEYGRTGTQSFFRDSNGVLRAADHQGAVGSESDPKVE